MVYFFGGILALSTNNNFYFNDLWSFDLGSKTRLVNLFKSNFKNNLK
jgi:putative flippase GtrA